MLISKNVNNESPKIRLHTSRLFEYVLDSGKLLGLVLLLCGAEYDVTNYVNRGG